MSAMMHRIPLHPRTARTACRAARRTPTVQSLRRNITTRPRPEVTPPRRSGGRMLGLVAVAVVSGAAVWAYPLIFPSSPVVTSVPRAEIEFEKPRKAPKSKEDNRDLISSQHLQVKNSWEHPGVYAWGSNAGQVVAPDSTETIIKTPRRLAYFDGQLLRDMKLDRDFGVAVTEKGDVVQWGVAYSKTSTTPQPTLTGKDIVKVGISRDRILALSSGGAVYSLPVAQVDQQGGAKQEQSSWIPFWSGLSKISYRSIRPDNLGYGEKIVDISSGQEHALLLTSHGRVYSLASSYEVYPSKGQLGIPGLTWATRPKGAFDQPHEITALKGFTVAQIATGDYHSVVLDKEGRVFAFGNNSVGQLGFKPELDQPTIDTPTLLPFNKLYSGTSLLPKVTSIAAGGANTFFTVDATKVASQEEGKEVVRPADLGKVTADTWATGDGLYGSLGTGKWTHVSAAPTKLKALSALFEYDETANKVMPIRLSRISAGATHSAAIMNNVTHVTATTASSNNDTNWGADVVFWGGNEHFQLGTGKRNNAAEPTYIGPLDGGAGDAAKGRKGEVHRFQITPRKTVRLGEGGKGRKVSVEQRVECGRFVTAVYSGT